MRCRPSPQSAKQVPPSKSTTLSSSVLRASHTCPGAKRRTKKLIHSQPRSCLVRCRSSPDSSDHKVRLRERSRFGGATLDIFCEPFKQPARSGNCRWCTWARGPEQWAASSKRLAKAKSVYKEAARTAILFVLHRFAENTEISPDAAETPVDGLPRSLSPESGRETSSNFFAHLATNISRHHFADGE